MDFAGISHETIANALASLRGADGAPDSRQQRVASEAPPVDSAAESAVPEHPALFPAMAMGDGDARYLAELGRTASMRFVVLRDPSQNLLAELLEHSRRLAPDDAVVVVDELGTAVGGQMRRAVEALLCQRSELTLEYRRFVDHGSRLSVIRLAEPVIGADPDAAKWEPSHRPVADGLAPLIVSHLAPRSAVDVGCGAGFWLNALAAHGVAVVRGVTPRSDGAAAHPGVVRAPLDDVPDLEGRFDVCLCLEVAQGLAPDRQGALVAACTRLSDVVVFSSRPPGSPGSSPGARPLPYWANLFWPFGYVLDDGLRSAVEERWGFPRTVFDGLVIFRRQSGAAADSSRQDGDSREFNLRSASRIHDLYMQGIWWATLANDRDTALRLATPPRSQRAAWPIPASRLAAVTDGARLFRFRTDAARWYVTHPSARLEVHEDGRPLARVEGMEALMAAAEGGWTWWRDEVVIRGSGGSDPRTSGRTYAIVIPAHVAWAESQPLADALNRVL